MLQSSDKEDKKLETKSFLWSLRTNYTKLLLIIIIINIISCGMIYPDDIAEDGIKQIYNITDISNIQIINKYKKTIQGETWYVYEFTIDKQDNINYIAVVKRGNSWYNSTMIR